jgi:hypothetical protein
MSIPPSQSYLFEKRRKGTAFARHAGQVPFLPPLRSHVGLSVADLPNRHSLRRRGIPFPTTTKELQLWRTTLDSQHEYEEQGSNNDRQQRYSYIYFALFFQWGEKATILAEMVKCTSRPEELKRSTLPLR